MNAPKMRALLIERDGEQCAHCDTIFPLTVDHIVPRAHGGNNRLVNLQLLCGPCNHRKGDTVDPAATTPERLRALPRLQARRARPPAAAGTHGSRHLPGCDGVYCMFGCPVFGERHPERVW